MTFLEAVILSIVQGVSELFPVSSLGHAVLIPRIFHWSIDETSPSWLAFLVALHLGTAGALLVYFRNEWVAVAMAFVRSIQRAQISEDHDQRLAWMVIIGTIPAGLVGFALEHPLRHLFASPLLATAFLLVNGLIMYAGEKLLQRQLAARELSPDDFPGPVGAAQYPAATSRTPLRQVGSGSIARYRDITQLSWRDAAIVGFAQAGALIPGISRSGVTMVAGLTVGLTHEAAARYSFLLATPIIGAAGLLELPRLVGTSGRSVLPEALIGMVLAAVAAYLSVRFLMRYFGVGRLYPFAYYCWAAGMVSLALLALH